MSSLEMLARAWAAHAWPMCVVFTAACAITALLRVPCRKWFGAGVAIHLWWLPLWGVIVTGLPRPAQTITDLLPAVVMNIPVAAPSLVTAHDAAIVSLPALWLLAWLAGTVVYVAHAMSMQRRYLRRLSDASVRSDDAARWPVFQANDQDTGPAMIGIWRPRIVLPSDFEDRYDMVEQGLILLHESTHAARRDAHWLLLAHAMLAAAWFHPLAWWSLRAFRLDQELACDAAVLQQKPHQRRCYAQAMLKTQMVSQLSPLGCHWSFRHPITERIAMLKKALPGARRRNLGGFAVGLTLLAGVGAAYAMTSTPATIKGAPAADLVQLDLVVQKGDETLAAPSLCISKGQPGEFRQEDDGKGWRMIVRLDPVNAREVDLQANGSIINATASTPTVFSSRATFGKPTHFILKDTTGFSQGLNVSATPRQGCPAREEQAHATVTLNLVKVGARTAALSVAARTGLTVVDPMQLDDSKITFNFDEVPAATAMRFIADADGRKVVIEGKNVRFAPK